MITVTTTYVRPNAEVNFYLDEYPDVLDKLFTLIAKSQNSPFENDFMVNDLTNVSVATYANVEQLNNFLLELNTELPTFFTDRDAYCAQVGITINREQKES
jgi:hypothetical protein